MDKGQGLVPCLKRCIASMLHVAVLMVPCFVSRVTLVHLVHQVFQALWVCRCVYCYFCFRKRYEYFLFIFWAGCGVLKCLTMLLCFVPGPTWSKRFTRPNGASGRQSKQLYNIITFYYLTCRNESVRFLWPHPRFVCRASPVSEASPASPASLERQWASPCLHHLTKKI